MEFTVKCAKSTEGKIKRVSDHTAELLMLTGSYSYCPKSEWKQKVRDVDIVKETKLTTNEKKSKKENKMMKEEKNNG